MTELALFLWALYISTVLGLVLDRWFEALREDRGQVPFLEPCWNWIKGGIERALRVKRR